MLGMHLLAGSTPKSSGGFNPTTLLILVVIVAAFYLLMIRPQQRRRQQAQRQQNTIQPGARVVTTAGMYATVVDVDGDDVILEVSPGSQVRYMKRAVMNVVTPAETADEPPADEPPADEAPAGDVVDDTPEPAAADAEETAYEQATGTKKD